MEITVVNGTLLVNGSCLERPELEDILAIFWRAQPQIHEQLDAGREVRLAWWSYNLRAALTPAGLKRVGTSWQDVQGHDMCQPLRGLASFLRSMRLRVGLNHVPPNSDIKEGFYFCIKPKR